MPRGRLWLPALATLLAFAALVLWRGYPWQLALVAALAIGILVYAARRTFEQIRQLRGGRDAPKG